MGGMGIPGGMGGGWIGGPAGSAAYQGSSPDLNSGSFPVVRELSVSAAYQGSSPDLNVTGGGAMTRLGSPGDTLLGSLEQLGVLGASGQEMKVDGSGQGPGSQNSQSSSSQLQTDQAKLQTDLQAVAAKSGVTVGDLNTLATDDQALTIAGAQSDTSSLQTSFSALATAVVSGADTTQARSDLSKALAGSASVPQATLDTAVNDVVQAIQDSHVTSDDLTTIAGDHTAIQKDLGVAPGAAPGVNASLVGNLANLGVIGSPGPGGIGGPMMFVGRGGRFGGGATQGSQSTQLQTDQTKLQTDLQAIAAKSGVTVAELNTLGADDQAIAQATTTPDATKLKTGLTELATAVSAGTDTTQAVTDINAAFANTGLSSSTISKTITDVTQVIQDSHITSDQLKTIAADQTAVQNDLPAPGSNPTATTNTATIATPAAAMAAAPTPWSAAPTPSSAALTPSSAALTPSSAMHSRIGHGRLASMRAHQAHGFAHHG